MTHLFQIIENEAASSGMERNIARLSSLARNLEMSDTATFVFEVLDQELT